MIKRALESIWNFLVAWGDAKHEYHKKHGYKAWY